MIASVAHWVSQTSRLWSGDFGWSKCFGTGNVCSINGLYASGSWTASLAISVNR